MDGILDECRYCDNHAVRTVGDALIPTCSAPECQRRAVKANEHRDPKGRRTASTPQAVRA